MSTLDVVVDVIVVIDVVVVVIVVIDVIVVGREISFDVADDEEKTPGDVITNSPKK